ncbi:NAD-glutamate dehydrogenase [Salinisphaera sp. P385]|uniref:NAD-glutamate dehydrogenase n=1 Tax=Spectribacter acetivorans TaxID=3075603 RepID=A0ABU3BAB4_9GAMM|nr:NAD-glutamate dehydrogenase [Salinisphaera sp. P385]MDT0619184.1 NAD-glutamate dehydrogenase [Salinisphaera sp. P385]
MDLSQPADIENLVRAAEAAPAPDDPPDFATFLRAYLSDAHPGHLQNRSAETLLAIARRHRRLADARPPRQACIEVYRPDYPADDRTRVVATVATDMPFLVDSVSMAVREAGGVPDWLLHPVLRVSRDEQHRCAWVLGPADSDIHGDEESFIHLQFEAGPDYDDNALNARLPLILDDLRVVVDDFAGMRRTLQQAIDDTARAPAGADVEERSEAEAFLRWLGDDHFTFLGYRQRAVGADDGLTTVPNSSLGLLREDRPGLDPDGYLAPSAELDKHAMSTRPVVVTKSNTGSWLHHADIMDVVTVKRLDDAGNVIGAHRFLGLFSGDAYAASPRDIPMLRRKVRGVVARAALRPRSHAAKTLHYLLETYPRDELFQSGEEELYRTAMGMLALRESQRMRLFLRRDRYGRFFSCMVHLPRERYSVAVRHSIGKRLAELLGGEPRDSWSQFLRGGLVRMHFSVATPPGTDHHPDVATMETELLRTIRRWSDAFRAALADEPDAPAGLAAYAEAFSAAYQERHEAERAVADAQELETLSDDEPRLRLVCRDGGVAVRLYGRGAETPLAEMLPVLQHFGLQVTRQRPFTVRPAGHQPAWIHDFEIRPLADTPDAEAVERLEQAFAEVWAGRAEGDALNALVLGAGLAARDVALLRTITRYLRQTPLPYSLDGIEQRLVENPDLAGALVGLFHARCEPDLADRRSRELAHVETIHQGLDAVASLDADRVLRACLAVVLATLRTNYFQRDEQDRPRAAISLKLDPHRLPELPEPRPMFEAFVYAPTVEGIHLRAGRVARGGLRWSDRREDFRTEVLGLMKAQVVKNAVIVPVGAKGGFVVKNEAPEDDRDTRQTKGRAAYRTFISALLDITDNNHGGEVVPPPAVVRHDGDDPYLVVAADKGTATFSDLANEVSAEYGFWLDDAFASGGSAGYDHKVMGITARGAWVGVQRHFRELGTDIQETPFSVVGIGDMGGDVFGNGMLLSRQTRLLAAFNHRHIFLDPDPDIERSYAERERLFTAEASGWDAYDTSVISAGGGVFERSEKSVEPSEAACASLGIEHKRYTPNELIHALLAAPVDLLWNGGIGTYVKARTESHAQVGDRANDGLRVDGRELRCRAVGEGGNLGLTQAGRIEYALAGGYINTDAIDNSGGVDSSDLEVNIKIALGPLEAAGELQREARNALLESMTEDVAQLVLRTNYLQTQLISLLASDAAARLDEHVNLMRMLERDGLLDRAIEGLPGDDAIEDRIRDGQGLTRPELAVLVSYAKITLFADVLNSDLPDQPHLAELLLAGFPPGLRDEHAEAVRGHRLRREIIATLATNQLVDRMGVALAHRLAAERGVARAAVVRAYLLAAEALDSEALFGAVEALDNRVTTECQYRLLKRVTGLLKHAVGWLLARANGQTDMAGWLEDNRAAARQLLAGLSAQFAGAYARQFRDRTQVLEADGVPSNLAGRLAAIEDAGGLFDMLGIARHCEADPEKVAALYFEVGDRLSLQWLQQAIQGLAAEGRWQALARASLRDDCYRAHARLVADILIRAEGESPEIDAWLNAPGSRAAFVAQRLSELRGTEQPGFEHLSVAVRDLAGLVPDEPGR